MQVPGMEPRTDNAALRISGLEISTTSRGRALPLVTDVNLTLGDSEIVGLVGESGSGKSITALACLGLLPQGVDVTAGTIEIAGHDVTSLDDQRLRQLRGPTMGMVFQDPMTTLDPCFRIGRQMIEAITEHENVTKAVARRRSVDMLGHVGIPEPERCFESYAHELSGGLCQRVMIATALLLEPRMLVADEPTTALDVTTQASILALVRRLCEELEMSVLWISHDLAVVAQLADRVAVMYAGEIVETGTTTTLFTDARHHYTRGLLDCAVHGSQGQAFAFIDGVVPEPADWPGGCRFQARCHRADAVCDQHPSVTELDGRGVRCHHPRAEGSR